MQLAPSCQEPPHGGTGMGEQRTPAYPFGASLFNIYQRCLPYAGAANTNGAPRTPTAAGGTPAGGSCMGFRRRPPAAYIPNIVATSTTLIARASPPIATANRRRLARSHLTSQDEEARARPIPRACRRDLAPGRGPCIGPRATRPPLRSPELLLSSVASVFWR